MRARGSPFVWKMSSCGSAFVSAWRPSHAAARSSAWSTSFWMDGSRGPSACGSGRTSNVAANSIAKTNLML